MPQDQPYVETPERAAERQAADAPQPTLGGLLVSDIEDFFKVCRGQQTSTIRPGWKQYHAGKQILIGDHRLGKCVMADVTSVRHVTVGMLALSDVQAAGCKDFADWLTSYEKWFGQPAQSQTGNVSDFKVTVITWENVRGIHTEPPGEDILQDITLLVDKGKEAVVRNVCAALNQAARTDPQAIHALLCNRVPASLDLVEDPYFPIDPNMGLEGCAIATGMSLLNCVMNVLDLPMIVPVFNQKDGRTVIEFEEGDLISTLEHPEAAEQCAEPLEGHVWLLEKIKPNGEVLGEFWDSETRTWLTDATKATRYPTQAAAAKAIEQEYIERDNTSEFDVEPVDHIFEAFDTRTIQPVPAVAYEDQRYEKLAKQLEAGGTNEVD